MSLKRVRFPGKALFCVPVFLPVSLKENDYEQRRSQVRVLPSAPLKILQMGMWRFLGLKPSGAPGVVLPAWAQISPFFFKKGSCAFGVPKHLVPRHTVNSHHHLYRCT